MSNFSFLLKLSLMQLVFAGMAMTPVAGLVTLILIEVLYLGSTLGLYLRRRHLRSVVLLIPRVAQSFIMLVLQFLLLTFYTKLQETDFSLSKTQQSSLGNLIFISNIFEYLFLGLNIFLVVKMALETRRKQKANSHYREYLQNRSSVIVYRKVIPSGQILGIG